MNNEYQIDDVCKFLDEKDMKKVNSYIENYKLENGGLDDVKVLKGRRMSQVESDLVAIQDPVDTSEIDIGTL